MEIIGSLCWFMYVPSLPLSPFLSHLLTPLPSPSPPPSSSQAINWLWDTQPATFTNLPREQEVYDHVVSEIIPVQVINNFLQEQKEKEEKGEEEEEEEEEEREERERFLKEFLRGYLKKINDAFGKGDEGLDQFLATLFRHLEVVFMSLGE